jgi:hypothetical protein
MKMKDHLFTRQMQLKLAVWHRDPDLVAGIDKVAVRVYLAGGPELGVFFALTDAQKQAYHELQELMTTATPWGKCLFRLGEVCITAGVDELVTRLARDGLKAFASSGQGKDEEGSSEDELSALDRTFIRLHAHALVRDLLDRHVDGDWGDVGEEDEQTNDEGVTEGGRLLSSYRLGGHQVWVITEHDRSSTTVLLPEDY